MRPVAGVQMRWFWRAERKFCFVLGGEVRSAQGEWGWRVKVRWGKRGGFGRLMLVGLGWYR